MTGLRVLGAAALLVASIATPATAQLANQEPGAYQQDRPAENIYGANYGTYGYYYGQRPSGSGPGGVGTRVIGGPPANQARPARQAKRPQSPQ